MNPTSEQEAILGALRGSPHNLMIKALAGTGKTSTLEMIHVAAPRSPVLFLAFNKRIATEMTERIGQKQIDKVRMPPITIKTFNGLGHGIWAQALGRKKVTLDKDKTRNQVTAWIKDHPKDQQRDYWDAMWDVIAGIGKAKSLGYIPEDWTGPCKRLLSREEFHQELEEKPSPLAQDMIDELLLESIRSAYEGYIDFNDQIYMSALFGGNFPRFPLNLVDEMQDLNPVNHAMLEKLGRERVIGVGDPWQSIYGFRGAVQDGMATASQRFKMTECDLSVSFRCPQAIVEAVHWRVPHFKWVKPGGHVETLDELDASAIPDGAAIICRNNAPLFRLAFELLAHGRSVQVAGSDIGPRLIAVMRKLGDEDTSRATTLALIEEWRAEKLDKQSKTANDMADCMRVFAGFGETLGQAIVYAEHLLKQVGKIQLLTGHKAKGLEWDTVYHLDPWLIDRNIGPHRSPLWVGDPDQEANLRYVITTRAKQTLFEINSKQIRFDQ